MNRFYNTFSIKIWFCKSPRKYVNYIIFCKRIKTDVIEVCPLPFPTAQALFLFCFCYLFLPEPWGRDKLQGLQKQLSKELFGDCTSNPRHGAQSHLNIFSTYRQGTLQPDSKPQWNVLCLSCPVKLQTCFGSGNCLVFTCFLMHIKSFKSLSSI